MIELKQIPGYQCPTSPAHLYGHWVIRCTAEGFEWPAATLEVHGRSQHEVIEAWNALAAKMCDQKEWAVTR